jgi:hypothetical protein
MFLLEGAARLLPEGGPGALVTPVPFDYCIKGNLTCSYCFKCC